MSTVKVIELLDPVGIDGIATIFTVLFVALVLLIARWLWR
jgi:hypothetical protein